MSFVKYLEHRRHSMRRDKTDNHSFLTQEGVDLARRVGEESHLHRSRFSLVVTSPLPRAIQTAVAMGYAVDLIRDELATFGAEIEQEIRVQGIHNDTGFDRLRAIILSGKTLPLYVHSQLTQYKKLFDMVEEDGSILIVSHGGVIDFPLVAMFPAADVETWGQMFGYCEGYRVAYNGNTYSDLEILRT